MPIQKVTKNMAVISALSDLPNATDGLSAATFKEKFDEGGLALKNYINDVLIPALESIQANSSGADQIGATAIADLNGTTVQALLKSIRDRLKATTNNASGADFVGAATIEGLTGTTVQALIRSLKSHVDTYDTRINGIVAQSGNDNTELVDARGGAPVLRDRLDSVDVQLAQTAIDLEGRGMNVMFPPAPLIGAKGDGTTDDRQAIMNLFNVVMSNERLDTLFFPPAIFYVSSALEFYDVNKKIKIIGNSAEIVRRYTDSSFPTKTNILDLTTPQHHLTKTISTLIEDKTRLVTVSDTNGLEVGGVVTVRTNENYAFRPSADPVYQLEFKKGFISTIQKIVNSTTIQLSEPVPYEFKKDGFTLELQVYNKSSQLGINIEGITFEWLGNATSEVLKSARGLTINRGFNVTINQSQVVNAHIGTYFLQCYNLQLNKFNVDAPNVPFNELNYGITTRSSHKVTFNEINVSSARSGLNFNETPCTNVKVINSNISSKDGAPITAHCIEDIKVRNSTLIGVGGMQIGGGDFTFSECDIFIFGDTVIRDRDYLCFRKCTLENCNIDLTHNTLTLFYIFRFDIDYTTAIGEIVLKGNTVTGKNLHALIWHFYLGKSTIDGIGNMYIEDNSFTTRCSNFFHVNGTVPTTSKKAYLYFKNNKCKAFSMFLNTPVNGFLKGAYLLNNKPITFDNDSGLSADVYFMDDLVIQDNILFNGQRSSAFRTLSVGNSQNCVVKSNVVMDNTKNTDTREWYFASNNKLVLMDNLIMKTLAGTGFHVHSGTTLHYSNNKTMGATNYFISPSVTNVTTE